MEIVNIYLAVLLTMAVYWDARSYRIPNWLICMGWSTAIVLSLCRGELADFVECLLCMILPIVVLFPLFALRMMGAGDLKLLSVIGGLVGTELLDISLYSFFIGGGMALITMLYRRNLLNRLQILGIYILSLVQTNKIISYEEQVNSQSKIHFSYAIAGGVLLWWIVR